MHLFFLAGFVLGIANVGAEESRSFKNETELGIVVTGGNTDVSTLTFKQSNSLIFTSNSIHLHARYLRSTSQEIEQAFQWGFGAKFEQILNDRVGLILGQLVEANPYQKINQRYATDAGVKVHFYRKEKDLTWFAETGYRFTRENYPGSFANLNFLRISSEIENYLAESLSAKLGVEFLPNLDRWKGYQFNGAASINAAVSSVVSLKTGYELRYNNEPPVGAKAPSDRIFTTSIVAKI